MRSTRRGATLAVGVLVTMIGLAACSAKSGTGDTTAAGSRAGAAGAPMAAAGGAPAPDLAPASGSGEGTQNGPVNATTLTLAGSKIRTAQLSVDVAHARDVAGRADRAGVIAESVGGEVDSDNRTSGTHAQADLVLRVPPQNLPAVLDDLGRLGTERSREMTTTDVTEKVADVDSRVRSAQAEIARLRTIYADATKISDVLAVEDDLSSRESDLEALQAQQRALTRQTSMATITLSLQTESHPVAPPKSTTRGGFLGGLERGWHALVSAGSAVATGFGAALPFLVVVLLLGLLGRLAWARLPRHSPPAPSPSSEQ